MSQILPTAFNSRTGLGVIGGGDTTLNTIVPFPQRLFFEDIEAYYHQLWPITTACELLPRMAWEKGCKFSVTDRGYEDLVVEMNRLINGTPQVPELGMKWRKKPISLRFFVEAAAREAEAYGGAAIVLDIDDGRPWSEPVDVSRIRSIRDIRIFTRRYIRPYDNDTESPDFHSEFYQFYASAGLHFGYVGGRALRFDDGKVHYSRVIPFHGRTKVLSRRARDLSDGWYGDSRCRRMIIPAVESFQTWRSVAQQASRFGIPSVRVKGLSTERARNRATLNSGGAVETYQQQLEARGQELQEAWSIFRILFSDMDKEIVDWINLPYQGQEKAWDLCKRQLVATSGLTEYLLFKGTSDGGGLLRKNDEISRERALVEGVQDDMTPAVYKLAAFLMLAQDGPCGGQPPEDWSVAFNDRYPGNPMEIARTQQIQATTIRTLNEAAIFASQNPSAAVVTPERMRDALLSGEQFPDDILNALPQSDDAGDADELRAELTEAIAGAPDTPQAEDGRKLLARGSWDDGQRDRAGYLVGFLQSVA